MQKLKMLKEDIERAKEILNKYNYGKVKNYKKFSSKKWTICEADGTELGEVEALDEIDAKVKFGIEHPEYADSLSICAKEIKSFKIPTYLESVKQDYYSGKMSLYEIAQELQYAGYFNYIPTEEQTKKFLEIEDDSKEVKSQYEQTTEQHLDYPNPSETPHTDVIIENHDGWVNTAEQKVTPEFAKLHSILGEYRKQDKIQDIIQDGKDLLVTCSPATSFELKEQIESLGYECEETDESETGDVYTLPTFVLRIKMK